MIFCDGKNFAERKKKKVKLQKSGRKNSAPPGAPKLSKDVPELMQIFCSPV